MVERMNRTLEDMLSKFCADHQCAWDLHLDPLMLAFRSAVHSTTGVSPFEMMMGRNPRLPGDLLYGIAPETPQNYLPATEYAQRLQDRLETVHEWARHNINLGSNRQKQGHDHRLHEQSYQVGAPVWCCSFQRHKGCTPKLS